MRIKYKKISIGSLYFYPLYHSDARLAKPVDALMLSYYYGLYSLTVNLDIKLQYFSRPFNARHLNFKNLRKYSTETHTCFSLLRKRNHNGLNIRQIAKLYRISPVCLAGNWYIQSKAETKAGHTASHLKILLL